MIDSKTIDHTGAYLVAWVNPLKGYIETVINVTGINEAGGIRWNEEPDCLRPPFFGHDMFTPGLRVVPTQAVLDTVSIIPVEQTQGMTRVILDDGASVTVDEPVDFEASKLTHVRAVNGSDVYIPSSAIKHIVRPAKG